MLRTALRSLFGPPQLPKKIDLSILPALLGKPDPLILEIGANDGQDSERFLSLFPDAALYCFEPDTRAIALWRSRLSRTSAKLIEAAVGATNGETTFHPSGGHLKGNANWHRSGSIHVPTGHLAQYPTITFSEATRVPILRLDDWAAENRIGPVDFVWADIQGAEGDLIEGGRETLRRTRFLHTEYSDVELYRSQVTLADIEASLPDFSLLARYRAHALLVNRALR